MIRQFAYALFLLLAFSSSFTQSYANTAKQVCSNDFVKSYNNFVKERKNLQMMVSQKQQGFFSDKEIKLQSRELIKACDKFSEKYASTICRANKSFQVSEIKGFEVKRDCDFIKKI